jgi:hypothetical protein
MKKVLFLILALSLATHSLAGVAVVGSLVRHYAPKPGETFEGIILLKNTGSEAVEMGIGQTDYLFTADGSNHYDKPGTHPRSNAEWLSVNPARAFVAPQSTVSVYYKGKVPAASELQGTYWSMIMVEPINVPAPAIQEEKEKVVVGIRTVMRYAVQIVTEIGATGIESLNVLEKRLIVDDAKKMLELDVGNNGERVQIPTLWAELYNEQGISIGRFEGGRWRIYPTCSVRYKVDLGDIPAGKYTAMIVMDTGGDYVTGAQYSLEIAP